MQGRGSLLPDAQRSMVLTDGGSGDRDDSSGSKRVLIHALRDLLPLSISSRPKKGFALPYEHWMQRDLAPLAEETCSHETLKRRGLIDPALVAPVREGLPGSLFPDLWMLMIFELWRRAVLDKYRQPAAESRAMW